MNPARLLGEYRKRINPPYSGSDILIVLSTIILLITIPLTTIAVQRTRDPRGRAAPLIATLYLVPASSSVIQGSNFSVQIWEDSSSEPVNGVQANLSYDPAKLDFVSIDNTGSAFGVEAENVGGGGSVLIARGVTGGDPPVTGGQLVATVTFTAKQSPGPTAVNFAAGSMVVSSTTNTDILTATTGGTYTIVDPPPTVAINSPSDNSVVSGNVTIATTATDDVGVVKVEFSVDGTLAGTDATSPYSFNWDSTTVSSGNHTLSAVSFDTGSNSSTPDSITVSVDNEPPSDPSGLTATVVSGSQIDLTWDAGTDNVGVVSYEVYRNGTKIDIDPPLITNGYSDTGLSAGMTYSYYVKAVDGQGNISDPSNTVQAIPSVLGDMNGDGRVDMLDLSYLLFKWRTADAVADINSDGIVDMLDLSTLLTNWTG